jgi:uncharacterized protein
MRAADADIVIHPGYTGGTQDHWYSRWEKKLSTARRVTQRDWQGGSRDEWVETLTQTVAACERPVVVIAHSLGVIATLHAAPRIADKVAGAFLVAPPSDSAMRELPIDPHFAPAPRRPLPFPAMLIGSSDDPYADLLFPRHLAQDIGARFVDAGAAGHINNDSGHGPWPDGLIQFAHFIAKL